MTAQEKFLQHELAIRDKKVDELREIIQKAHTEVEWLINATPTGNYRDKLTDINIELLKAFYSKP